MDRPNISPEIRLGTTLIRLIARRTMEGCDWGADEVGWPVLVRPGGSCSGEGDASLLGDSSGARIGDQMGDGTESLAESLAGGGG